MTQQAPIVQSLPPQEERTWAMLAHLSVLLNLFSGILGPVAAFVIFFVFRDRSRYVAFHALQAFWMQLVLWVGGTLLAIVTWTLASALAAVVIGLCLFPLACLFSLLPIVPFVYGIVAAIAASQGRDFRYPLFASWAERMLA